MNNYVWVGKIVNSFGIKGEVKILSDFEYKDRVFKKDAVIYIGINKDKEVINTHRVHKNFHLVTFNGYSNINEILKYKGCNIYVLRSDLKLKSNEYLYRDLIGYKVVDKEIIGIILDYELTNGNVLLKVKGEKIFYIPLYSDYVVEVDQVNKNIVTNNGRNLII